jgi:hypothetical protein
MRALSTSQLQPTNNLNISTSTTLNAGSDDPRLVQMLQQY